MRIDRSDAFIVEDSQRVADIGTSEIPDFPSRAIQVSTEDASQQQATRAALLGS
jgi:hypothetical protein